MAAIPTAEEQLLFLTLIQRLLDEGEFVATYKYALLLAITELAVELGNDDGGSLDIPYAAIADKFLELYWSHLVPIPTAEHGPQILSQIFGRQAAIVNLLIEIRKDYTSLSRARGSGLWAPAIRETVTLLEKMPLWRLQTLRREQVDFLYGRGSGSNVRLMPGVAFNLRRFQGLIQQLARNGWISHIRSNPRNAAIIRQCSDLEQFLFGANRVSLATARKVLREIQADACFYCGKKIRTDGEVDHFIPWARYPRDLGHNFVLAHKRCNLDKRDLLAAAPHLERWWRRNEDHGTWLSNELGDYFVCDLNATARVARWSYRRALENGSQSWLSIKQVVPLSDEFQRLLPVLDPPPSQHKI